MGIVSGSWLLDSLLLLGTLVFVLYLWLSRVYSYFQSRGIPYIQPIPFLGDPSQFKMSQMELANLLYNRYPDERYYGLFQGLEPTLVVRDLDLINRILVKDFTHFYDHGFPIFRHEKMVAYNLFHLEGQTWRTLRNKLTPTFTTGKLKLMFEQFLRSSEHMVENIEEHHLGKASDAKEVTVEFATEVIASTAFGIDFSRDNPQTVEFVSRITNAFVTGGYHLFLINTFAPKLSKLLNLGFLTPGTAKYFVALTKSTKEYRRQNKVKRNDYFDLLLALQEAEESGKPMTMTPMVQADEEDLLINQMQDLQQEPLGEFDGKLMTDEMMSAQSFSFLMAGSETVSGTIAWALYQLAKESEVQDTAAAEVDRILAKHNGWSYQAIKEKEYLDLIIQETLRMYPVIPTKYRVCTQPYQLPGTEIVLAKGTKIAIPVASLQMDPRYYPEPEVFRPERFTDNRYKPNPTYLPFGDGPRICIGMRFAIVEMKVCLAKILSKFSIQLNSKTREPIKFDIASFVPKAEGGIWINLRKK